MFFRRDRIYWLAGVSERNYCATELKPCTKKVDFLTKEIERTAFVPFDRYGSRASKNGRMSFRSPPIRRKVMLKVLKMADFVWGFWSL